MRFTIIQIMIFTALVAAQIQSPFMMSFGFYLSITMIPCSVLGLAFSGLFSEASQGQLDVGNNPTFRFIQMVLVWCCVNLVISLVLIRLFPPPPPY